MSVAADDRFARHDVADLTIESATKHRARSRRSAPEYAIAFRRASALPTLWQELRGDDAVDQGLPVLFARFSRIPTSSCGRVRSFLSEAWQNRAQPIMAKITLIGAGSVEFTRILLADLVAFPELAGSTIALHDIDEERLVTAREIARYTDKATGAELRIEASTDRRTALEGSDFVVNEIQVGGLEATLRDFDIPRKYGLRQTIADTIGVGGIFRGLRTIPVMISIANDMAEVCPDALLLNYANPMAMLTWAVWAGSRFRNVVGLCHSVQNTHEQLAEIVGVPLGEIEFTTAGLNHQAFVLRFERNGNNLYPLLDRKIEQDPDGLARRVRVEIYRQFGFFPTESSEHSAEYVPWFMVHDEEIVQYRIPVDEYVYRSQENIEEYADIKRRLASGAGFAIEGEGELAPRYIHSLLTATPRLEYGNVRNDSLIDDLPDGCCVEVPCEVDGTGVHPIAIGSLPPQCAALNRTFLNVVDLTVRAALEERRDHVYQAVMLDPNAAATLTLDTIRSMVDELIAVHGELIPEGIRNDRPVTRS